MNRLIRTTVTISIDSHNVSKCSRKCPYIEEVGSYIEEVGYYLYCGLFGKTLDEMNRVIECLENEVDVDNKEK